MIESHNENIIVHITEEYKSLFSILSERSLRLSFSSENFYFKDKAVSKAAHPMICFSEYNPKTINQERITYGSYGIGFSKKWARNNNIGPVLYVSQTSVAAKGMKELLTARRKTKEGRLPRKLRLSIMEVKCFMKNEIGYNSFSGELDFDFKAENEWRYIPKKIAIDNYLISQNQRTYLKNKDKHNEKLKKYPLQFNLNDIGLVYVSNKSEKIELSEKFGLEKEKIRISEWNKK
ncbi:abortive infection system antitoxin AbiGi family protein [Aquimarina rubra]|uniref:Abortive infection system antitoxin AbiGi family protein n=1 Tax=Aquimarina rubra TaxID=1920033 RepID=A0ABW5LAM6_9FLAO